MKKQILQFIYTCDFCGKMTDHSTLDKDELPPGWGCKSRPDWIVPVFVHICEDCSQKTLKSDKTWY